MGLQTQRISATALSVCLCLLHQGLSPVGKSLGGHLPPRFPLPGPPHGHLRWGRLAEDEGNGWGDNLSGTTVGYHRRPGTTRVSWTDARGLALVR